MTFYVTDQNRVVLTMIVLGAVFGLLWDILRIKRYFIKTGYWWIFAEDLVFCVVFAFVYHIAVFAANYGYVRWFQAAGAGLGFALYRLMLSDAVMKILITVTAAVSAVIYRVMSVVLHPFIVIAERLWCILKGFFNRVYLRFQSGFVKVLSDIEAKRQIKIAAGGFYHDSRKDSK